MKTEKILSMTNGQHILYGMICSHIVEEFNYDPTVEVSIKMMELIIELDSPENYDFELTPSEAIEQCLTECDYTGIGVIFEEFFEENESYILELAAETNSNIREII